ncbi:MAG: hypothetical protein ACC658_06805 [Acidimicrobiia bacterium]
MGLAEVAVETNGTVQMRGDSGPGVNVVVSVDEGRLRILSGNELVGEWELEKIGIHALQDGFAIRAEGEEFVLKASDEVGLAEEMGLVAASPRLARKVAVSHNPEPPPEPMLAEDGSQERSNVDAIAFALGGVLVLLGGSFLRIASATGGGGEFWLSFIFGGLAMVAVAFVMSIGPGWARAVASLVLVGVIVLFGLDVSNATADASYLTAYGFIAGGLVVGVAVVFSGTRTGSD